MTLYWRVCINQSKCGVNVSEPLKQPASFRWNCLHLLQYISYGKYEKYDSGCVILLAAAQIVTTHSIDRILTFGAGRGHLPGKHSHPGFRWNTSHRSGTCQQEAHILVNYTFAISTANHREGMKKQPPITAGHGRAGQGRPGRAHAGGGRRQGGSSPGGSSQSWCRVFVLGGRFWFGA